MSLVPSTDRRGFLRSACRHCVGLGAFGSLMPSLAQTAPTPTISAPGPETPARFTRPGIETEEGGLWAIMDREETRLRRSSFVIKDSPLNVYVRELVCRLGGDHCTDVRVHVVRTPQFNATMAPNGSMQIWSGLLLRMENEAQLAGVLGHELGHYLERHTLERMRDLKNKAAIGQFLAAFGLVGAIAQLGVMATVFAFSREQEERADRFGMHLMKRAGYDGAQAAAVWDNLLGELRIRGGEDAGSRSQMLATHPPAGNRRDELLRLAGAAGGKSESETFRKAIAPHRMEWLRDEVRRGQYDESVVLLARLLKSEPDDAQLLFARGESYRLRDGAGDLQLSLDDLTRSASQPAAPADTFRSLGLVHQRRADVPAADAAFEKYLALAPDAADAGLVKTYISGSKP